MWLSVMAVSTIVPAVVQAFRVRSARDGVFWSTLALGIAGPLLWVLANSMTAWQTGLAATLWVTIAATLALFAIVATVFAQAWRIGPLLAAYMLLLGIVAVVLKDTHGELFQPPAGMGAWIGIHIAMGVTTYGLVTIAAVAAFAAFLQERSLKRKRPTSFSRHLPSIADCEALQRISLLYGWAVLSFGLLSGMALQYEETRQLLPLNHKVVLLWAAFAVIGALLAAQRWAGVRGQRAARLVLLGHFLMTLGYLGVKFVTEVLIA